MINSLLPPQLRKKQEEEYEQKNKAHSMITVGFKHRPRNSRGN